MKEINRVFFGEKGITSTSANHLANLAKECMESNRRALEGVGFITSTVRLLSGMRRCQCNDVSFRTIN